ncbi:MAG: agmatine/peptidylarginine deiminase [Aquabacterium sp.]
MSNTVGATSATLRPPAWSRRRLLGALGGLGAVAGTAVGPAGCGLAPSVAPAPAAVDFSGWRVAGEFETTRAMWLGWDQGHADLTAALIRLLRPHVPLRMLVANAAAQDVARAALGERGVSLEGVDLHQDDQAMFFMRDVAVFLRGPNAAIGMVDFQWDQYGLPAWCARRHVDDLAARRPCAAGAEGDRGVLDRRLAARLGAPVIRNPVVLEGGGIECNGDGLALVSEPYLRSRNPTMQRSDMERALLQVPGLRKIIWLAEGAAEDPLLRATVSGDYVAWGTGGHTDEFVRFADARTVLLAWPDDDDRHPVARLNRQRMQRNWDLLRAATDAHGRPLQLVRLPTPRVVERPLFLSAASDTAWSEQWSAADFPAAERRWQGQRVIQVACSSYLNFIIANGVVVVPDYTRHGTPRALQDRVAALLRQALPGRELAWVDAIGFNWVGGGPHCATLNEPG